MELIVERSNTKDDLPSAHAMNTFFYPKLSTQGFKSVRRWTKRVDIFSKDLIFYPIHLGIHWTLAVSFEYSSNRSFVFFLIARCIFDWLLLRLIVRKRLFLWLIDCSQKLNHNFCKFLSSFDSRAIGSWYKMLDFYVFLWASLQFALLISRMWMWLLYESLPHLFKYSRSGSKSRGEKKCRITVYYV